MKERLSMLWFVANSVLILFVAIVFTLHAWHHKPLDSSDVYYALSILLVQTFKGRHAA